MSEPLPVLIAIAAMLALAGCSHDDLQKPDLPDACAVVQPKVVVVERIVYVKVPAELTKPEPIAEGPIGQCFSVAAQRRAAQERANSKLKRIAEIEGTEVTP